MKEELTKTFGEMDFNVYFGVRDASENFPVNGTEGYIDFKVR